ncbi:MAG TPA: transposase [Terriglobales bacterium]|nr:transposase [Terriglobales bacterium]
MAASKKGVSANPLHRVGADGGVVKADETYIGRKPGTEKRRDPGHKEMVFALVERNGEARSVSITSKMFDGTKNALHGNLHPNARLNTDHARIHRNISRCSSG